MKRTTASVQVHVAAAKAQGASQTDRTLSGIPGDTQGDGRMIDTPERPATHTAPRPIAGERRPDPALGTLTVPLACTVARGQSKRHVSVALVTTDAASQVPTRATRFGSGRSLPPRTSSAAAVTPRHPLFGDERITGSGLIVASADVWIAPISSVRPLRSARSLVSSCRRAACHCTGDGGHVRRRRG
jgi:hypothetical protein